MKTLTDDDRRPFVAVPHPAYVIIGVQKREDFDRIAAPMVDRGESVRGHVLTKTVEGAGAQVTVVFHYWLKTLTTKELLADIARDDEAPR